MSLPSIVRPSRLVVLAAVPLMLLLVVALVPSAASAETSWTSLNGTCQPTATRLCLLNGQIAVDVLWNDPEEGAPATSIQNNSGWFSFDDPEAPEIVVSAADACGVNDNYWVQAMGLSSRAWQMTVTLFDTGDTVTYTQAAGPPDAFVDTQALPCPTLVTPSSPSGKITGANGRELNLWSGRFQASISWSTSGPSGSATAVPLANQGGTFWFFTPSTLESSVKIEGAGPDFFRVVHSWVSNAEIDLEIVDRCTGQTANYFVSANSGPGATVDDSTFPLSPNCVLLVDGFESGDVSSWSSSSG